MAIMLLPDPTDAAKPQPLILLIQNNLATRAVLRRALETQGYDVLEASDTEGAIEVLPADPMLIIADLDLPNVHIDDLLIMLRERNGCIPIVAVSNRANESCIVQALDLGADAYLIKPFGLKELFARMRNLSKRQRAVVHDDQPLLRSGDLSVDLTRRLVTVGGRQVKLTPKEYQLLQILMQHAGKVLTHRFLLGELWNYSRRVTHLRGYIRQLRLKIEADPEHPRLLLCQAGIGYRILAPSPPETSTPRLLPQPFGSLDIGRPVFNWHGRALSGFQ